MPVFSSSSRPTDGREHLRHITGLTRLFCYNSYRFTGSRKLFLNLVNSQENLEKSRFTRLIHFSGFCHFSLKKPHPDRYTIDFRSYFSLRDEILSSAVTSSGVWCYGSIAPLSLVDSVRKLSFLKGHTMIRVGIVGFGFMGRMHYANWGKCENAEVVAICDSDPDIIANSQKAVGNIEGADSSIDFDSLKVYSDFDKMLADGVVDAISLTLPTFLHCEYTVKALQAGLHVLCEKPMALNLDECSKMAAAAEKSGKILQIGHCIRFWPEYVKAKQMVDSGEYGKVISATFQRLGSAPGWGADDWFSSDAHSGGVALDLHIHDADYIQYLLGMPRNVQSFGNPASGKGLKCISTRYDFGDDKLVTAEGSWAMSESFGFEMSFNIVLEKAIIVYDCSREKPFRVCPAKGDEFTPEVAEGDGYLLELKHFAGQINGEKLPEVITLKDSINSIKLVKSEIKSIQTSGPVNL